MMRRLWKFKDFSFLQGNLYIEMVSVLCTTAVRSEWLSFLPSGYSLNNTIGVYALEYLVMSDVGCEKRWEKSHRKKMSFFEWTLFQAHHI